MSIACCFEFTWLWIYDEGWHSSVSRNMIDKRSKTKLCLSVVSQLLRLLLIRFYLAHEIISSSSSSRLYWTQVTSKAPFLQNFFCCVNKRITACSGIALENWVNFQKRTPRDLDHIWFQAYAHENIPILEEIQTRVYKHMVKLILNPCGILGS